MQSGHLRQAGIEIIAGAVALLIAGMVLTSANMSELRAINIRTQNANAALRQVAEVNNMAIGIEMSVRGLALTDDPIFRDYLLSNEDDLRKAVNALTRLVADVPQEDGNIAKLHTLSERHIAIYDRLSLAQPDRAGAVSDAIVDPTTREVRYRLLKTLYSIRDDELKLLGQRQIEAERKVRQTFILSFGIVLLAFVLATIGLGLIRGERPDDKKQDQNSAS